METKVWKTLPEEVLYMILARLPMRVLGIMKTICRKWYYLLSSRDALQVNTPNWSLHSTPGFVIQTHWHLKDDVECWVIEGRGLEIYRVPLFNHVVVNTCKSIFCCHRKGDRSDLSIGIPGSSRNWRNLPRCPICSSSFGGMAFDSSARRCTILFGNIFGNNRRRRRGQGGNIRIVMYIYDSESNAWKEISRGVPYHIQPCGKGIYSNGKFYWAAVRPCNHRNLIVAFNIAEGAWTEIPLPEGCSMISRENLGEYNGQVVLVEQTGLGRLRIWKLNEAETYEIWCEMRTSSLVQCIFPRFCSVTVNSNGLIMVIDAKLNMSIYNSKGEVIAGKMTLPGLRRDQLPTRISVLAVESNNLWWP